ncbi:MAG: hydroxymethylglutaryl-CoA synthase family protein [Polyangiales bacterium]
MSTSHISDAVGIASIGIQFPPLAMPVEDLAKLRGEDPNKYTLGLGCSEMALCPEGYGIVQLAAEAGRRALARWRGRKEDIGLIAVGTESSVDMSRPLSAWVASELGISGAVRSYEVKHACYGGTLALRQATEWRLCGAARGKAALVIAADIALYAQGDPGEPTQGAGAVAMVVDAPEIAAIDPISYPYSEPAFDFWRPVGKAYPLVEGPLSLECYQRATAECFRAMAGDRDPASVLAEYSALCFHVPFPKMVKKGVMRLGEALGLDEASVKALYADKVEPTMQWNRSCGNAYTASLWISVANALRGLRQGERITAFSYGSGFGAELLTLEAGPLAAAGAWAEDVEGDLQRRRRVDSVGYEQLRA